MKSREQRKRVRLDAHMRADSGWAGVSIHNVSSHGMMLRADRAPKLGSYIELRRDDTYYTVRTVWVNGHLFGVRAQDRIDVGRLIATGSPQPDDRPAVEWRIARTPDAERSKAIGRALQFVVALCVVIGVAALIGSGVHQILRGPAEAIRHHLGGAATR